MRIGYVCTNQRIGCVADKRFRLASYSDERLAQTVRNNLDCLERILSFNAEHGLRFFRITSDLVPFASHPVCSLDWRSMFAQDFARIGAFIRDEGMRISMHPDQFVLINSPDEGIVERSIADLGWQCEVLEMMGLDASAKVQIHVGGVYGDRGGSMERFIKRYDSLPDRIKRRLVIENDDRLYPLSDCLAIAKRTGVPIVFDVFHHACLNDGESLADAFHAASVTWRAQDGVLMVDYSSQQEGARKGKHTERIDEDDFMRFLEDAGTSAMDVMLEIKDKETSALRALELLKIFTKK